MKMLRVRWLALACLALAACWLYSCSDESTTCPKPKVCPVDPADALLGTWVVFEATMGGDPAPIFLDWELEFQDDDTLWVRSATDSSAQHWLADDSILVTVSLDGNENTLLFHYEFEADTLNMHETLSGLDVYWRLHRK